MRKFLAFLFLFSQLLYAQDYVMLTQVGIFDNILHETSGVEVLFNPNSGDFEYWSHNDHDNTDSIYSCLASDLTNMTNIVDLGMPNTDWEDITTDDNGNIYVGEFGSWSWQDRHVLKIPDPNTFAGPPPSVEKIRFTYPAGGYQDMEAMFHLDNYLYLFVKAVDPNINPALIEGMTYVFRIPDVPMAGGGQYVAEAAGQFMTMLPGDASTNFYRVTAADISPDKKVVAMLCYERLWVFSCFDGDDFFSGNQQYIEFVNNQKEGLCFINNHEIMITKEGKIGTGPIPKMFHFDLYNWIDQSCLNCEKLNNGDFGNQKYGWTKALNAGANATFNIVGNAAQINVTATGTSLWHVTLRQKGLVLENGKTYQVKFKAHADNPRDINIIASDDFGGQHHYKLQSITTSPTTYSYQFTMNNATDFNARLNFGVGRDFTHSIYLDDVSVMEVDCACPATQSFTLPMDDVNQQFEASNLIEANNKIRGSSNVTFDAANCIELNTGFEVEQGVNFESKIDGCGGN